MTMTSPRHQLLSVIIFGHLLLCVSLWSAEPWEDLKKTNRAVHDFAGIVDSGTEQRLEALLFELYRKTNASQVVVTVPDLGGLTVEDFATRLFEKWGIGDSKTDRGVMLLVAPKEKKLRIEVGYGLEPVITDIQAKSIIEQHIVPLFKSGNMSSGVFNGSLELMHLIAQDSNITLSEPRNAVPVSKKKESISLGDILFYLIFAGVVGLRLFGPRSHRRRGSTYWVGGSGWGGGGFGGGSSGGFGGFGGGMSGGGGASGGW